MKRHCESKFGAFTAIELIVIIAIMVLLACVLIPGGIRARQKAKSIRCVSYLKQIGLSFRLWAGDNGGRYPMSVSVTNGGTLEVANDVWRSMEVMSNELATPFILACLSDSRSPATNFAMLSNSNISYFIGLDSDESRPEMLLAGDRYLSVGRAPVNRIVAIKKGDVAIWGAANHLGGGNVAFADGSVQQYTSGQVHRSVTNAVRINWETNTNATLRLAMPD